MNDISLAEPPVNGSNLLDGDHFKRQLLATLVALNDGDFSARLPSDLTGLDGKIADTFNQMASRTERFGSTLSHLRTEVGLKGKIKERMPIGDAVGDWAGFIEDVNALVDGLSQPIVEMGRVIGAVAKGDLTQSVPLDIGGSPL